MSSIGAGAMTSTSPSSAEAGHRLAPVALGVWAGAVAVAPGIPAKLLLVAPAFCSSLVWWTLLRPERWLTIFFLCSLLLPPLPAPVGNAGVHIAPIIGFIGVVAGIARLGEWRSWRSVLPLLLFVFCAVLAGSAGLAFLYSGWAAGFGSLARVGLFAISVYVFLYTLAGPRDHSSDSFAFARFLFFVASLAALFACVDFYYQLPAPAGYAPQFVWLTQGVFRRAQGLFYEASTLGNFCAFFLVMILVAFFRPAAECPCSRLSLTAGAILFSAALVFSSSRASIVTVLVACIAFAALRRIRLRQGLAILSTAAATAGVVRLAAPAFASHYWDRIVASFTYFGTSPDAVLSGRVTTWNAILDFLAQHPWHLFLGIGYKTLPYTSYPGQPLVADNTYLSLLVETGLAGIVAFCLLNVAIMRTAWRAAKSTEARASFFGAWIFCFWAGQIVQMFSGDLITYWRVLPVYFWVLATAAREADE
jgi:hypothetical protein